MEPARPVMVLGATGVFGSRVCRLLLAGGAPVVAVARGKHKLGNLERDLAGSGSLQTVQATLPDELAPLLVAHRPAVVIDTAGPFQGRDYRVPRACIDHGIAYLDLSDGREDVAGITRLDDAARVAGVAVLSGVSTVCALSSAVVEQLRPAFGSLDAIDIAIAPGNDAPRGKAVTGAVLSWVGQPVPRWRDNRLTTVAGWQELHRRAIGSLGKRWLAACDVPDNVLLGPAYGARHVRVYAGMELSVIHLALWLLSWPVRKRILGSLRPFADFFQPIANALRPFGTDTGGMVVALSGADAAGLPLQRIWNLEARQGDGPMIPAAASAALALAIRRGEAPEPGARPCLGEIGLDAILAVLAPFAITAAAEEQRPAPLFRRAMGEAFTRLPPAVRRMHDRVTSFQAHGRADIAIARNPVAHLLRLFGLLPRPGTDVPTRVAFAIEDGRERWSRHFGAFNGSSVLDQAGDDHVRERFGPIVGKLRLIADGEGLTMEVAGFRYFGLPVPRFLWLRAWGLEGVNAEGRFTFDVGIGLPLGIGLVTYRGLLVPDSA